MTTTPEDAPAPLSLGEPMARLFCQLLEGCFSEGQLPDTAEANELLGWIARSYPHLTTEREFAHLPWADAKAAPGQN